MPHQAISILCRLATCIGLIYLTAFASSASILHTPEFKVDGVVIVWGGETATIDTEFPKAKGGKRISHRLQFAQTDVHASGHKIVQTAHLTAQPSPPHPLLHTLQGQQASFYVASNTAFNIDAALTNSQTVSPQILAQTGISLKTILKGQGAVKHGHKAQYPHSNGPKGGINLNVKTLADLIQPQRLFTGNQRTAAAPGSIAEQSVQFIFDVQNIAAETHFYTSQNIVFTVFIP